MAVMSYGRQMKNETCKIKNKTKTVDELSKNLSKSRFDIRLMTEGRMKGQAFITLPNVDRAREALNDTNWVMLQGKPLVVQFARSAQTNTTSSTT
jgi:RNA recognition motif-containing protein